MGLRFDDSHSASRALFARARRVIPGGTSKANLYIHPHPLYLAGGRGCRVTDVDGVERLDAINGFTALMHGHAFPPVVEAVSRQLAHGTTFAASTPEEIALAELVVNPRRQLGHRGCHDGLSTPRTEREVEELAMAFARALARFREGADSPAEPTRGGRGLPS